MHLNNWLIFLVIGAAAGWLAGALMKGRGFGLLGNIFIGVLGAVLGGYLVGWLGRFGISIHGLLGLPAHGLIVSLITAFIGAALLLLLARLISRM